MEYSCKIDALEIQEIIYRKYANAECIMNLPILQFIRFIELAIKKEQEDILRPEWCALLPFMSMKYLKYMSFDEYVNKRTGRDVDTRPANEIIKEIEEAHKRMRGD